MEWIGAEYSDFSLINEDAGNCNAGISFESGK